MDFVVLIEIAREALEHVAMHGDRMAVASGRALDDINPILDEPDLDVAAGPEAARRGEALAVRDDRALWLARLRGVDALSSARLRHLLVRGCLPRR